jgi:hypothetical protein
LFSLPGGRKDAYSIAARIRQSRVPGLGRCYQRITVDDGRNRQQADGLVQAFARDFQVGFPVGWVSRDRFMTFMGFSFAEYTTVPQVVVIDRKGNIHYQTTARGDETSRQESTIRQRIEELLALRN